MQITIREPGSALTHFIAMLLAAFAAAPLLTKAALYASRESIIALSIFCVSMILLYGASATYHSLNLSGRPLRIFRKIDHMMIFILIAGSYTPICLTVLGGKLGYTLLAVIWGLALFGMILKACWITCPKWFSSIISIGGVIYALKLPLFNAKHEFFGSHEIFHLFVMAGSFCHFIFMYCYVA